MIARWTSPLTGSVVYEADARKVAETLPEGVASCAILDGPFNMGKAAWDRIPRGGTLGDLYTGHLDDVGRVCAKSASLYVWNTSRGLMDLDPLILARGWTYRATITWEKGVSFMAGKCDVESLRTWYDTTEVCGFYQREAWSSPACEETGDNCGARSDEQNRLRLWLIAEWSEAGLKPRDADAACGVGCMASRHYFPADQWMLPTWEHYQNLAAYATAHGPKRERPYFVHPSQWPGGGLRASYDSFRPPFTAPLGVGNVWQHGQVQGIERLRTATGETLHPCQKPLLFAERMIRASTRPGDTVWVPFGGTLRELVAAERMARGKPEEARRVITCELNQDGVDYIGPAIAQAQGLETKMGAQVGLFGGAA